LEPRNSHGLEQFCASLEERSGLWILDLAAATQQTVSFITEYGHRIYPDDFLRHLDECFGGEGDFFENQSNPRRVEHFLQTTLDFPDGHYDGALVWDSLEYLTPNLLGIVVERLYRVVKPGSSLLAIFHTEEKLIPLPAYNFRIQDHKTLLLTSRGMQRISQPFNNRTLEKLFQEFQSVKFFLTRGQLREVIIRR
jgi:hypothetical protein